MTYEEAHVSSGQAAESAEPEWRSAMIGQNLEEKGVIVSGEKTRKYSRFSR